MNTYNNIRRVIVILAILSLLFTPAAAPMDQPAPPAPATHYRYEDWAIHPAAPLQDTEATPLDPESLKVAPATIGSCGDYHGYPDANQFTRLSYQKWVWSGLNWEIHLLDACDPSHLYGVTLAESSADDFYPNLNPVLPQVVFVSDRDGNDEIYRVNTDNTNLTRLTSSPAVDTTPAYSPDGQRIAFVSNRTGNAEIYIMNADGSAVQQITNYAGPDLEPSWSPDGSKIIWVRAITSSDGMFYTMNLGENDQQPLTGLLRMAANPRWSPSGSQIAFTYDVDGNNWFDLGLMNADGSNLHLAMHAPAATETTATDLYSGTWLADDKFLYYTNYEYKLYQGEWRIENSLVCKLNGDCITRNYDTQYYRYDLDASPSAVALDKQAPIGSMFADDYVLSTGYQVYFNFDDMGPSGVCNVRYSYGYTPDKKTETVSLFTPYTRLFTPFNPGYFEQKAAAGSTIYYWLEIQDCAENWRKQDAPDAVVHVYDVKTEGRVLDQRGQPVGGAVMDLSRPPLTSSPVSMPDGSAEAYFSASGETQTEFSHAGFGSLPPQTWPLLQNEQFVQVMAPDDEQITNGGFEDSSDPLQGWVADGSSVPTVVPGHTGSNALGFGQFCSAEDGCLGSNSQVSVSPSLVSSQVFTGIDSQGTNYLMMVESVNGSHVLNVARYQEINGWLPTVRELALNISTHTNLRPAVDSNGTLHLIYEQKDESDTTFDEIYYIQKPAGGAWSEPKRIGNYPWGFISKAIAVDSNGKVHVAFAEDIYREPNRIFVTRRDLNGTWSDPVNLMNVNEAENITLAAGEDGTTHIVYSEYNSLQYNRLPAGAVKPGVPVALCGLKTEKTSRQCEMVGMDIAPDGKLHILLTYNGSATQYIVNSPATGWDFSRFIPYWVTGIDIDQQGYLHAVAGSQYMVMPPDTLGYEQTLLPINGVNPGFAKVLSGPDSTIHMLYLTGMYIDGTYRQFYNHRRLAMAAQAASSSLERTIQVPSDLNHPTLSFLYRWVGYASAGTHFSATLTPVSGPVVNLLQNIKGGDWQPVWADLSPYAGQSVVLRFQFDQAAGERSAFALIDEVSLGSWNTPVIEQITTFQICPPQSADVQLQVIVKNFQDGGQILVAGQPVTLISYQPDNGEMTFQLPQNMANGPLSLQVINPGGADALLPGAFFNGCRLLMPQIIR
jgi:hypothetical protein